MRLLSIFQRKGDVTAKPATESGDPVQQARTKARRRLIGAVVLLGIGIIGFPLVFETQPRPIPVDIPIEIPAKDGAPPLAMPPARMAQSMAASTPVASAPARPGSVEAAPSRSEVAGAAAATASKPVAAAERVAAESPSGVASRPASSATALASAAKPAVLPKPASASAPQPAHDGPRAQALLEAKAPAALEKPAAAAEKPPAAAEAGRYVVQVGAFAEAAAAREVRLKVEKLGMKTYTQVAQTSAGNRIRVRVGPFMTRAEADRALAKAKAAGLGAVVLTL